MSLPSTGGEPARGGQRPLQPVRLAWDGGRLRVVTSAGGGGDPAPPRTFALPPVPRSLLDWLALFCRRFYRRHRRCVAALLLLDVAGRRWAWGIPTQRSSADSTCWRVRAADFPRLAPTVRLAGSFQSRVLACGEAAADAAPPVDGVHLVLAFTRRPGGHRGTLWLVVRGGGGVARAVHADRIITDDVAATLSHCLKRVELA